VRLRPAHFFDRAVRDREVDLPCSGAGLGGRKPDATEQALDDAMMSLILEQRLTSPGGKSALPSVSFDQSESLERGEVA
jgi:hypothetical protein